MTSPKNAWSDENDLRWYTFNDVDYLSVTSMRKALGMPYNLHRWVLKQTLEAVQQQPDMLVPQSIKGKPETPANVRGRIMRAGMAERDASAERGTDVHEAIASGTPLSAIDPELVPYVEAYANAVIVLGIKPLLAERQVFNDRFRYAGSFDLLALVRAKMNRKYIIDLKTGKSAYAEHALQGMAYVDGEFIGQDDKKDEAATRILKNCDGIGILHLHPGEGVGWTFHDIPITPELRAAHEHLAQLSRWFVEHPTLDSLEVK